MRLGFYTSNKVDALAVRAPGGLLYVVLKTFGEVGLLSRSSIEEEEADEIRFVPIALHATPCHVLTIRGERGVGIVAHHALG